MTSQRKTSVMGEIKGANPDLDVPLTWLQRRNPQKTYHPGYMDESDIKGMTFANAPEIIRLGIDRAIERNIVEDEHPETVYKGTGREANEIAIRNYELELIHSRERHDPDCRFVMPDTVETNGDSIHHPEMSFATISALQRLPVYMLLVNKNKQLNNSFEEDGASKSWTKEEFEQWLSSQCNLRDILHRDSSNGIMRIVYQLDSGRRFFVIWFLVQTPNDATRFYRQAALFFFSCKCTKPPVTEISK